MESSKKRRGHILRNSTSFVLVVVSFCSLLVLIFSTLGLPEISLGRPYHSMINRRVSRDEELGKFAEMMIEMLPEDLAFTVFVPSAKAFERDLRLQANDSPIEDNVNNTYAIVSRILGFSAVPRTLFSVVIPFGKEISYDSLSGFTLYISKASDGMLVVNRVKSERVNLKKGKIIVHLMDGVIMEADFEQSVQPDNIEED
ncbi:FAS1 domain protein [Melia azedarach]|uniref:FAS1 domain protein n=1 Tax=Melia azedarach TaxID=155640 RepID=A0ACC1Y8C2_MELAZ|nr:FAS1 domain protein [Melia azedarach]